MSSAVEAPAPAAGPGARRRAVLAALLVAVLALLVPALRPALSAASVLALVLGAQAAQAQRTELVSRAELRVCADPNNLPFSNEAGEGFENRIAQLIADDLGLPVTYVWFPQVIGFVRNTLRARQCDLVPGTVSVITARMD